MGTTGYDVRGYDLDGNGKRSFAWVWFGWVRELQFITGPVPFHIPVETFTPREKYRGNIPEKILEKKSIYLMLIITRLQLCSSSRPSLAP